MASQTAILTPLTSKQAPPRIVWDERGKRAFDEIRSNISQACMLYIPLPQDTFFLVTDTSGLGIGGVLKVHCNREWEAAAFFYRQLRGPEQRYSATELEALAVVATVEHFNYYLYGRVFQIYTDHKPLVQLMTSDKLNPRLRCLAYKLQHWMLELVHLPGVGNTVVEGGETDEKISGHQESPEICPARGDVEGQPPHERRVETEV